MFRSYRSFRVSKDKREYWTHAQIGNLVLMTDERTKNGVTLDVWSGVITSGWPKPHDLARMGVLNPESKARLTRYASMVGSLMSKIEEGKFLAEFDCHAGKVNEYFNHCAVEEMNPKQEQLLVAIVRGEEPQKLYQELKSSCGLELEDKLQLNYLAGGYPNLNLEKLMKDLLQD